MKKMPGKQNPYFSFFTTYPGGTPLGNPDRTESKGIELGADGPPGDPLEITDTHNGTLKVLTPPGSVFNPSGRFLLQVLNLLDGPHTFGLRANSGSLPFHEWLLTVGAVETLTIASLKGLISGVEIPSGTSTSETLFALSGKARASANIDLYDNGVFVAGPIAVDANGNWTYNTGLQTPGPHSYTVRGKYDSGPESAPPRTLNIGGGLIIADPSPLILNGRNYTISGTGLNWIGTGNDPVGTSGRKTVSGGQPPYTYTSSAPATASVDNTGLVRSEGNGSAVITVRDNAQNSVTFTVQTSNVKQILVNHQQLSAAQAAAWIASVGATQITNGAVWQAFATTVRAKYQRGPGFVMEHYFTGEKFGTMSWSVATVAHDTHPEGWLYLTYSSIATNKTMCEK